MLALAVRLGLKRVNQFTGIGGRESVALTSARRAQRLKRSLIINPPDIVVF